ncbi:phospholipase-like protein [Tanacetum coccineum]
MEMANPPEIFNAKVGLKSKMHLLSMIKGDDAPFIQAVIPGQNVDKAPIVNEQSDEIDEQSGAIDDHEPAAPTDSNNLFDDYDSFFKEVIDVRPDLVGRVDKLRTKLVQTLTSNPSRATLCDDSLKQNDSNGEPLNCYYQESQQGSLQNLVKALESELEPDVSCLQVDNFDVARFDDAVKDNDEMEHAIDVDNEEGKYCLDDMSIGFEEDKSNGEIKSEIDVEDHENIESTEYDSETMAPFTEHIELWVELLWRFRAPDADWALAGPHFCPAILGGGMPVYISKVKGRCVPWTDVEKVYFPLNQPEVHWALAELHLRTGVLKRKGLLLGDYKITFQFEEKVPHQGSVYGDYGVWVCLLLYRLTHKIPLVFGDPLQVALAYRKRMLAY